MDMTSTSRTRRRTVVTTGLIGVALCGGLAAAQALQGQGGPLMQTTDDQGSFRFQQLQVGEYTLTASKPGYLPATFGQKRPGSGTPGTPISVVPNQRLEKLAVAIPRGSVLTGTIVDDAGEPAFGVQVRALKYVMRSGARVLEQAALGVSDDRGIYRIPALAPGQYWIMATPRDDAGVLNDLASAMNVRAIEAVREERPTAGDSSISSSCVPRRPANGLRTPVPRQTTVQDVRISR